MKTIYQVVLLAEDGEYIQEEFDTQLTAYNYLVANQFTFGEGQTLTIREVSEIYA